MDPPANQPVMECVTSASEGKTAKVSKKGTKAEKKAAKAAKKARKAKKKEKKERKRMKRAAEAEAAAKKQPATKKTKTTEEESCECEPPNDASLNDTSLGAWNGELNVYAKEDKAREQFQNMTNGKLKESAEAIKEFRTRCYLCYEHLKTATRKLTKEWMTTSCEITTLDVAIGKKGEGMNISNEVTGVKSEKCKLSIMNAVNGQYFGVTKLGFAHYPICREDHCLMVSHWQSIKQVEKHSRLLTCPGVAYKCKEKSCNKLHSDATLDYAYCIHGPKCPHYTYTFCKACRPGAKEVFGERKS